MSSAQILDVNAAFNFGHNSVTYSITDGENTAEKTIEIGESSTVDWDGNVILM